MNMLNAKKKNKGKHNKQVSEDSSSQNLDGYIITRAKNKEINKVDKTKMADGVVDGAETTEKLETFEDMANYMKQMFQKQTEELTGHIFGIRTEIGEIKNDLKDFETWIESVKATADANEVKIKALEAELAEVKTELAVEKKTGFPSRISP